MTQELAGLRTLGANPAQGADLNRLSPRTETKFAELAEAVRKRRDSGPAAAEAVVRTNIGKRTMDELRVLVAGIEARQDALLAVRIGAASQSYNSARLTLFTTSGMAGLQQVDFTPPPRGTGNPFRGSSRSSEDFSTF